MGKHNIDGRVNFGIYFINEIYQWGYEVVDTIDKTTLMRGYNYPSMEDARQAGFEKAKQIIHEMEDFKCDGL